MRRSLVRVLLALSVATAALAIVGASPSATNVGLQPANLGCTDGTNLDLALDLSSLTALTGAVSGMRLYPAGDPALACSVTQSSGPSAQAADTSRNGPHDFAVGGGQRIDTGCAENFALSAHVPDDTPAAVGQPGAGGTVNLSIPAGALCVFGSGSLVAKVDCVQVSGTHAELTAEVTKARGVFAPNVPGTELAVSVDDYSPLPDWYAVTTTPGPCVFGGTAETPITAGNINVHDA